MPRRPRLPARRPRRGRADGWATIETCTVKHGRDGGRTGIVIGRLDADGRRFVARGDDYDTDIIDLLSVAEPIGERVYRSLGLGNRVTP
jgi:acetyl-CoA C-acetyltransferase